ncbi:MAG: diguanylate cyclase [Rhodospirillales bacterium]|nr:diguanylate cyclase [Rhodospirillales bacterium]
MRPSAQPRSVLDVPARLWLLALLAVGPLLGVWLHDTLARRSASPDAIQAEARDAVRTASGAVQVELIDAVRLLRTLAAAPGGPCAAMPGAGVWPEGIGFFGVNGTMRCGSVPAAASVAGQDFLRAALLSPGAAPVLAGVPSGWITGRPATVAALPLPPAVPGGAPVGVLAMGLSLESLRSPLAADADAPPPAFLLLSARDLTVLAGVPATPSLGRRVALPVLLADARQSSTGAVLARSPGGRQQWFGWQELSGVLDQPVLLTVLLPDDFGTTVADRAAWLALGQAALAVVIGLFAAWLLVGRRLAGGLRQLAQGPLSGDVAPRRLPAMLAAVSARLTGQARQLAAAQARLDAAGATLAEATEELRLLAAGAGEMFEILPPDLSRRAVRGATRELLGYDADALQARAPQLDRPPEDWDRLRATLDRLVDPAVVITCEQRVRRQDGGLAWLETRLTRLRDGGVLMVSRDVSRRRRAEDRLADAERRLATLALEDVLTGLANRRRFDEAIAQELRRAFRVQERLGLVLIELDQFAGYRDSQGHVRGDATLRRVARAVAGALRRPGDLAARLEGDRVAVLLPGADRAGAALVAKRMLGLIRALQIPDLRAPDGLLTASAGTAAVLPLPDPVAPATLLDAATAALATAQRGGRECVGTANLSAAAPDAQRPEGQPPPDPPNGTSPLIDHSGHRRVPGT